MKYTYEVWAVGFDKDYSVTDFEQLLGEFETNEDACEFASNLDLDEVIHKDKLNEGDTLHIEVETVVDEDDYRENIETTYEATYEFMGGKFEELCINFSISYGA